MDTSEQCDSEAVSVKLKMTKILFLFIGVGANEIHPRIIADQWVECNSLPY